MSNMHFIKNLQLYFNHLMSHELNLAFVFMRIKYFRLLRYVNRLLKMNVIENESAISFDQFYGNRNYYKLLRYVSVEILIINIEFRCFVNVKIQC